MMQLQRRECSTTVTNQINLVFPAEAFTDEATNFWFGLAFGVGICVAYAAMRCKGWHPLLYIPYPFSVCFKFSLDDRRDHTAWRRAERVFHYHTPKLNEKTKQETINRVIS